MIINKEKLSSCIELLQTVLFEAFQTEALLFSPPYKDLSMIDQGIRSFIYPDIFTKDSALLPSKNEPERRFFVIRSNLGFYNIIIYLNDKKSPDFISIGPFRCEELSLDYFQSLVKNQNLPSGTFDILQRYYETIPFAPLEPITNVTRKILTTFFPEYNKCEPIYYEFTESNNSIKLDEQLMQDLGVDFSLHYQESLFHFLEFLAKGNYEASLSTLKEHIRITKILNSRNLLLQQQNLHYLNDICQLTLLNTNVHPSHVLKLHVAINTKINSCTNRDMLLNIPNEICHKYCLLVKNYAFQEYSKTVRSVVNYIHMHLEEDLTLSSIAKEFNKNASSLSAAFSKEVGMSITNYIHHSRIDEAIRFFNTTKMSVSEVAFSVGFHDFAYFSRLFHKQVGCSPREYCKSIR